MDLPLPKFAAHVMATSPPAGGAAAGGTPKSAGTLPPTLGSVPTTPVTPDAPKRPPSQSPLAATTAASLASVPSLKSPTPSSSGLATPAKALNNSKTDNNTSTAQPPLTVEASGNAPHDPRLLLQVAPHPKSPTDSDSTIASGAAPNSPAKKKSGGAVKGKGGISSDIEVSDISDSEECGGLGLDDLDSRLKAFTKNYEAWQGTSTKFPPAVATAVTPSPAGRIGSRFSQYFA